MELYYIQNTHAGFLGNAIIFWAMNSRGYTCDLKSSHKFTADEAKKICLGNPEKNKAWPVEYLDNLIESQKLIIDCQYLEHDEVKKWD